MWKEYEAERREKVNWIVREIGRLFENNLQYRAGVWDKASQSLGKLLISFCIAAAIKKMKLKY